MPTDEIFSAIVGNKTILFNALVQSECHELNQFNQSPLHLAIGYKRDDFARQLLQLDVNVNQQDYRGQTPLHFAAAHKNSKMIQLLIEKGADVSIEDQYGNQPLWTAVFNSKDSYDMIEFLMNAGADPFHKNKAGKSPKDLVEKSGDPILKAKF